MYKRYINSIIIIIIFISKKKKKYVLHYLTMHVRTLSSS